MGPLHWEPLVLATGPPGKSQEPQVSTTRFCHGGTEAAVDRENTREREQVWLPSNEMLLMDAEISASCTIHASCNMAFPPAI